MTGIQMVCGLSLFFVSDVFSWLWNHPCPCLFSYAPWKERCAIYIRTWGYWMVFCCPCTDDIQSCYPPDNEHSPWKSVVGRRYFLVGWPIFRGYVSFRGSTAIAYIISSKKGAQAVEMKTLQRILLICKVYILHLEPQLTHILEDLTQNGRSNPAKRDHLVSRLYTF